MAAPERHRVAEDAEGDVGGAQMRGGGKAVRPGADDRDRKDVTRLDGFDRNVHGKLSSPCLQARKLRGHYLAVCEFDRINVAN